MRRNSLAIALMTVVRQYRGTTTLRFRFARSSLQEALSDAIIPGNSMAFLTNPAAIWPIIMLCASNVFMTFAWYGHLKFKQSALVTVILVSWGIAFFEYCLAVPANRLGSQYYTAAQLKTIQEVITLLVFSGFSVFFLKESLTINHAIGFALIVIGAAFVFRG
ncbi:hypothetical protein SAMN05880593_12643 [Rhizobium sp. RU36D]|nr:hypothetical protein SAMN05880593_12643 [Rhizobium sp. RU36D]